MAFQDFFKQGTVVEYERVAFDDTIKLLKLSLSTVIISHLKWLNQGPHSI